MTVNSSTKTKRDLTRAEQHDRGNSFCTSHPELSSHGPSTVQSEPDVVEKTYRRTEEQGVRAHVRSKHVLVTKKK